jgi:DnaK suppressor protein
VAKKVMKKAASKIAATKSAKKPAPAAAPKLAKAAAPVVKQATKSSKAIPVKAAPAKPAAPTKSAPAPQVKPAAPSRPNLVQGALPRPIVSGKGAKGARGANGKTAFAPPRPSAPIRTEKRVKPSKEPIPFTNRPVPVPVTTDGKPKKNQAGLSSKELEQYREALLAKRRELVGDMSQMEREALRSAGGTNLSNLPLHMADMGTDNYEQEFTLGLVEKDRQLLREINQALAKIQDGSYGICEGTGKPIGKARLDIMPWARFSVEYARQKEQGFRRM